MWEYLNKYGIIGIMKGCVKNMLELFLLVTEKLVNDPIPLLILLALFGSGYAFLKKRQSYIYQKIYADKVLIKTIRKHFHGMLKMFIPICVGTEVVVKARGMTESYMFVACYIPLLLLVICQRMGSIHRERKDSYAKCLLYLCPGISYHTMYIVLLLCANKGIWIIAFIFVLGIVLPGTLDIAIINLLSQKDIKMVRVTMNTGEEYDVEYGDLIKHNDEVSIRFRDSKRKIKQVIIVKKEDVAKQTVYVITPKKGVTKGKTE